MRYESAVFGKFVWMVFENCGVSVSVCVWGTVENGFEVCESKALPYL